MTRVCAARTTRHWSRFLKIGRVLGMVVAILVSLAAAAGAQPTCVRPVALFESVRNTVQLIQASTRTSLRAVRQGPICAGDTIQVGDNSRAVIVILASNTPLAIDQNSEFIITEPASGPQSVIDLLRGALLYLTRTRRSFEVRTPFVNASVEGTEFLVRVQTDRAVITVFEGAVRASNLQGTVLVGPGQQAVAVQGQSPVIEIPIRPRDAVQWALYYQPAMPLQPLDELNQVPVVNRSADFYVRRASALLAVGQVEAARIDIDDALRIDPDFGAAYALRAVIAVAVNDPDEALAGARAAILRSPESAVGYIAMSYALQARFDISGARAALIQAVQRAPEDGLAWARLAEIELSLGDRDRALTAARRATAASSGAARANTVLGFAALAATDLTAAESAFQDSIGSEPNDPLPRLGLALAQIRAGSLTNGRRIMEVAAAMNPGNSLVRSYLGKAYFEERNDVLAGEQFALAKRLDPQDPTPWFYNAVLKQITNRPVEALSDMRRAIELNGNRGVYRSRLLLDQDSAARGAALARIYQELGFEQLALNEGWKSLAADPTEYSAHRLLTDVYSILPRHEIARVSEFLQAQLRQPLNFFPVRPQLAEATPFFAEEAGPSRLSFNEFNPLFLRDRFALQTNVTGGSFGSFGNDTAASAVYRRLSASVGQYHVEGDGTEPNQDLFQNLYNAILQVQPAWSTNIQAEYRLRQVQSGHLIRAFDPTDFQANLRQKDEISSLRLGIHQTVTPRSELLFNGVFQRVDLGRRIPPAFERNSDKDGSIVETQHVYQRARVTLVSGLGAVRYELVETVQLQPRPGMFITNTVRTQSTHENAYVYSFLPLRKRVSATIGLSVDKFNQRLEATQANPKFGVLWTLNPDTMIRGSFFRTLKRTLITNQTLEPTNVSGFNQFFDDLDAASAWRYGVGADRTIHRNVHLGAEMSGAQLRTPVLDTSSTGITQQTSFESREREILGYMYWAPTTSAAVSGRYTFQHFENERALPGLRPFTELATHVAAISIRWFHPTGLSLGTQASRIEQKGTFLSSRSRVYEGADDFWTIDAFVRYRLPRRMGVVSVDAKNLLDRQFQFQEIDSANPRVFFARYVITRISFSL